MEGGSGWEVVGGRRSRRSRRRRRRRGEGVCVAGGRWEGGRVSHHTAQLSRGGCVRGRWREDAYAIPLAFAARA